MASASIKMDELLLTWLSSEEVYEKVLEWAETYRASEASSAGNATTDVVPVGITKSTDSDTTASPQSVVIPPFYPPRNDATAPNHRRRNNTPRQPYETWEPASDQQHNSNNRDETIYCARDQAQAVFVEFGQDPPLTSPSSIQSDSPSNNDSSSLSRKYLTPESFVRITKDVCRFPSYFNLPLYHRLLDLWNGDHNTTSPMEVVTYEMLEWYWRQEMEPYDAHDRFYRLIKQPTHDYIVRDDFLPFLKALLNDHPGLEFLAGHDEFQEKYAVTVITRIFYYVNRCHTGRITSRQVRRSDLLEAFLQADEEEDLNNVTRFFSYEHFYVFYCRFWELDHDRDYRITREDLLKYGDHSLSHMIVDRIFDAAPRPFHPIRPNRDYLSYEDFIYFMLSEEDKSNEVSVRYWFSCVDVDGDGKLNNMEMRSFYAVQLHRMQCMGHEIVPFEDMLCQMMDMIKPASEEYFVAEDFLQPECIQVSGALFDALFNLNKYMLFEQRDPFAERQKREDEFECDWDRFACIDYRRLSLEEEAREEEMDWVTVDDEEGHLTAEGFTEGIQQQQQQQQAVHDDTSY